MCLICSVNLPWDLTSCSTKLRRADTEVGKSTVPSILSVCADIPSEPVDLDVSRDANKLKASSVVQRNSSIGAHQLSKSSEVPKSSGCIS